MKNWSNNDIFKILPFNNVLIDFMEQPRVKKLTNIEMLNELPIYNSLNVKEVAESFKRYVKVLILTLLIEKILWLNYIQVNHVLKIYLRFYCTK